MYYCYFAQDALTNIAKVELFGLWIAKKGITKVKVMLKIEKNLVGFFVIKDIFIKSKKSIMFNTKITFCVLNSHNIITSNK